MSNKEKIYEIWSEGFAATGESGTATFHGKTRGKDFKDAVKNLAADPEGYAGFSNPTLLNFKSKTPTYWGCRLFDNETKARKSFG